MKRLTFLQGVKEGLPICFAYIAVSFTFGLQAVKGGLNTIVATIISATNLTSAGQFAGLKMIQDGTYFLLIGVAVFIINSRYMLMSLSLSQNLGKEVGTKQRLLMSFFVTDEIFAVSYSKGKNLNFKYFMGLALTPFLGWTGGTLLGGIINSLLPASLSLAMGIALYCMFVAIIIPPATKSFAISFCIALGAGLSCIFYFVPYFNRVPFGISVIICSVISAIITALIFPIKEES